jgi:phosphonate transport system substrate-binding protein
MKISFPKFFLYSLVFLTFFACSNQEIATPSLTSLRIGILPDESKEKLVTSYTPLFKHLSKETGIPYRLVIPQSYKHLLELFENGKVDLAYFGGYTFVKANATSAAQPLVMRDIDTHFTSIFLIKTDNKSHSLSQFKGKPLSFGSRLSTSGHLMPRFFISNQFKQQPENFFSKVLYSGKHDKTAYWVRDGVVDVGVANSAIIEKMFQDGRLLKNELRVLVETPAYPDYVWAVQAGINNNDRDKIKTAFLQLSINNTEHSKILKGVLAEKFVGARVKDFAQLKQIAQDLDLLK